MHLDSGFWFLMLVKSIKNVAQCRACRESHMNKYYLRRSARFRLVVQLQVAADRDSVSVFGLTPGLAMIYTIACNHVELIGSLT
jgi:hypothetical protein